MDKGRQVFPVMARFFGGGPCSGCFRCDAYDEAKRRFRGLARMVWPEVDEDWRLAVTGGRYPMLILLPPGWEVVHLSARERGEAQDRGEPFVWASAHGCWKVVQRQGMMLLDPEGHPWQPWANRVGGLWVHPLRLVSYRDLSRFDRNLIRDNIYPDLSGVEQEASHA